MRKLIPLFMVVLMLLSILPINSYSVEKGSEVISFNNAEDAESKNFILKAEGSDDDGWFVGYNDLTISAKEGSGLQIERIEAVTGSGSSSYGYLDVTDGTKRETARVNKGTTIHVDNIHSPTFSFIGAGYYIYFKSITVYYEPLNTFSEKITFNNNVSAESKSFRLDAKDFDEYGWYGGTDVLNFTISAKKSDIRIKQVDARVTFFGDRYDKVGVSSGTKREKTGVDIGTTVHVNNINSSTFSFIGGELYCQFDEITIYYEYVEPSFPGSIISQGNLWIVIAVALVAAIIFIVLIIIKKKKKKVHTNGTTNDNNQ